MPKRKKESVDVAVILADASPILTLQRIGRLDVFGMFNVPIHIVDQVHWEVTRSENDPTATIADTLKRMGNQIEIIETLTGLGFQAKRARDPKTPSGSVGELAVNEYAISLIRSGGPRFVPLVFYEDPDMEQLPIALLTNVHMLNTTAFLTALAEAGVLPEGRQLIEEINALRKTPMRPIDEPARTKKIRSTWIRKASKDAQ
jgi:hypothetical protein